MTNWINKLKSLLAGYLGTEDDKYLLTEDGLKLWIIDHEWQDKQKYTSNWTKRVKNIGNWTNKTKH